MLLCLPLDKPLEGTGGADPDTVTAEHASGIRHIFIIEGGDVTIDSALAPGQGIGVLQVVGADLDTTPAHHALGIIADVEGIILKDIELLGP